MTVQQMCGRIERLPREGAPPVPQTGWVTLPEGGDSDNPEALWRDWGRVVRDADPRFECGYESHCFRVRPARSRPWPVKVREGRSLRLLLALHRSRLRGASCAAARAAADVGLAENTAYQALVGLARLGLASGLGRKAYRLALEPGRDLWLTPAGVRAG